MKALKQDEVRGLAHDADDARRHIGAFIDTVYSETCAWVTVPA
jgi:putative transposase